MKIKRLLLIVAVLSVLFSITACDLIAGPVPSEEPQPTETEVAQDDPEATQPPEPTEPSPPTIIPTEAPQPTDPPEATATELPQAPLESVDMEGGFWLWYDPELWSVKTEYGYSQLISKNEEGCHIMYRFGHGMDSESFKAEESQETIGETVFTITNWIEKLSGKTVLISFTFADEYLSVEGPYANVLSDLCIEQTYDVIRQSEKMEFKP